MKKLMAFILLFALLLSCCACGADQPTVPVETTQDTEPTETTAPDKFADVNELEPNNRGVYQIHSVQGLLNIANHPDGEFELLRDIDLGGITWTPIGTKDAPFTGEFRGKEFTVSNFKIEAPTADGDLGFFGVNAGTVQQLFLADVTVITNTQTQRAGMVAGTNTGNIRRCSVEGTMMVTNALANASVGGAVGLNSGDVRNSIIDVDMTCDTTAKIAMGGLVGTDRNGAIRDNEANGCLWVTGTQQTVGLLVGDAGNTEVLRNYFKGEDNRIDGILFTNYLGQADNAQAVDCRWRDNDRVELPAEALALRDKVEKYMYDSGTILWTTEVDILSECPPYCNGVGCRNKIGVGQVIRGVPYRHATGSLERMIYCLDENDVVKDWVHDLGSGAAHARYMGSSCYSAVQMAWASVANSMNVPKAMAAVNYGGELGLIHLGDGFLPNLQEWADNNPTRGSHNYIAAVGLEGIYESYALVRKGDCLTHFKNGAHAIMAAQDAVVMRDDTGKIDPTVSYVVIHEQGGTVNWSDTWDYSSWGIYQTKTFAELSDSGFLAFTIEELLEGEKDIPEATLEGGLDGVYGLTTGIVKSNFFLDSVTLKITDDSGNVVLDQRVFTRVDDMFDYGGDSMFERYLVTELDMANFQNSIRDLTFGTGQTYRAVITADLHTGDHIVVKDYTF